MALVLADRVRETTTVTGTGTATLLGAAPGYQSFSAVGNANTTYYVIANQSATEWEVGIGTYTASGTLLSRDTVLSSSNSGSLVNFSAGTKDVFVDYPASKAVYEDASGNVDGYPITGGTINNTTVGATTPADGTFTTLTGNSTSQFGRSSANYLQAVGGATTVAPIFSAQGSDTNIDLNLTSKSAGVVNLNTGNGTAVRIADFSATTIAGLGIFAGSSGQNSLYMTPYGSGAGSNLILMSKGTGNLFLGTNSNNNSNLNIQANISHTASAVNYVQVTGAATGSSTGVAISAQGSDANVNLGISSKSNGSLLLNAGGTNRVTIDAFGGVFLGVSFSGGTALKALAVGSQVNFLQAQGAVTGFGPLLSSQGTDTNIPLVLQPKGTGALQAQQTDSTATGGNARGANAVDWQTKRSAATQVASGLGSVICGGEERNTASGQQSFVGTGYNNNSSTYGATIVSGVNNSNAGLAAFIGAGSSHTIGSNGAYSVLVGGNTNTSSGRYNFIGGGTLNSGTSGSAVTSQATTAVTSGSTAVTLSASNGSIKVGQLINGTGMSENTYVAAISGTSLTLSQNATATGTPTLTFLTPHGIVVGGGNNQATGSYSFIGGGGDAGTAANRNVASGDWSSVLGGNNVRATGKWSTAVGGGGNLASGEAAVVVGGGSYGGGLAGNTASSTSSFVGAGYGNTANGYCSTVVGGTGNVASNNFSFVGGGAGNSANTVGASILGGYSGTTRSIEGMQAIPACIQPITTTQGASQAALLILGRQTVDATATVLTSNTGAASTTNQVILPNNSAYAFRGTVIANVTGGGNTKAWAIEGAIKRGANAASTALVGTPAVVSGFADAGAATWVIAVTADTTNGGLAVTFTGQAATTIRCVAKLETTEVTF